MQAHARTPIVCGRSLVLPAGADEGDGAAGAQVLDPHAAPARASHSRRSSVSAVSAPSVHPAAQLHASGGHGTGTAPAQPHQTATASSSRRASSLGGGNASVPAAQPPVVHAAHAAVDEARRSMAGAASSTHRISTTSAGGHGSPPHTSRRSSQGSMPQGQAASRRQSQSQSTALNEAASVASQGGATLDAQPASALLGPSSADGSRWVRSMHARGKLLGYLACMLCCGTLSATLILGTRSKEHPCHDGCLAGRDSL